MKTAAEFLKVIGLYSRPLRAPMYYEPYDWWTFTPLFPGEPIVSYSKDKVWFVEAPYTGTNSITYKPEIIPLVLYVNQLLMRGKITC